MEKRINIKNLEPASYKILIEMENYLAKSDLSLQLRELIKIRASQINKCAYCLNMHTIDARNAGESEQKIYALSAWKDSPLFSDVEKTVLAITEEVTLISKQGLKNTTYKKAKKHFNDKQIAQIILIIGQINFWNRIAVSTKLEY
ncbi:MAG: carboxymuconolactone decarboxylase family protein [Bacteroidetes bacterium]|nr:carboxymuconolactone decarboxylase family protein [Bacteroidota bacterium]